MTKIYFKKRDLGELKEGIRNYGKYLLIFSVFGLAYLFLAYIFCSPYEIEIMLLIIIAYLSMWAMLTMSLIFDIIGHIFYQDDGDKSNDKVYL